MPRKSSKSAYKRIPPKGTVEYERWRKKLVAGIRAGQRKRRDAGLLSVAEVSVLHELPIRFVRKMAVEGTLPVLAAGRRRYIKAEDAERVFGRRRGQSAA